MVTRSKKRKLNEMTGDAPEGRGPLSKRKWVEELQLHEFLEREIARSHEKSKKLRRSKDQESTFKKRKKPKHHDLKVRKELSQEVQALVIFLMFGSIISDQREWLSQTKVFKRKGVKLSTQHKLIARWRKRNFLIMKTLREGRKGSSIPSRFSG